MSFGLNKAFRSNGNIHSIELDVDGEKLSISYLSPSLSLLPQPKQGRKFYLGTTEGYKEV